MSSPTFYNDLTFEDISFSSLLKALDDEPCQFVKERGESPPTYIDHVTSGKMDSRMFDKQQNLAKVQPSIDIGLAGKELSSKARARNRRIRHIQAEKRMVQNGDEEGLATKKLDHNAKERIRRMKLKASYLALRSLLPSSRRSKKRWTAPVLIEKILEYIPELENEMEKLNLKKDGMLLSANSKQKQDLGQSSRSHQSQVAPTVSVNEVTEGEVIVQICMRKSVRYDVFSNLIQNVEGQGMCIASASTLVVCDDRVCYHLHIQMNDTSLGADYISVLRDKVLSWLC